MKLGKHINELLFRYDCVIIPGFGGFVGNYAPARINPSQHKFYPPAKGITFNKNLTNNDGLLANLIAQKKNWSFEKAMRVIKKEVEILNRELALNQQVEIESIGSFRIDGEKNLLFEPKVQANFLLESYGLTSFQLLPVEKSKTSNFSVSREREVPVIPLVGTTELKKFAKIAAAASVFFALVWIPLKTDLIQQAGIDRYFSNVGNTTPPEYQTMGSDIDKKETVNELSLRNRSSTNETPKTWSFLEDAERFENTPAEITIYKEAKEQSVKADLELKKTAQFHVVGGCFEFKENAEKLVRRLRKRGFSAAIAGKRNNLHVVSYGSFVKKSDAIELLDSVQTSENKGAWLLRK